MTPQSFSMVTGLCRGLRSVLLGVSISGVLGFASIAHGQETARRSASERRDSAETANIESRFAVTTSGVWNVDGEFKGKSGEYFKITGYFAHVAATSSSRDDGDNAVIAVYMEPMAGGTARWVGARLSCWIPKDDDGKFRNEVRCLPVDGANVLLDCNIVFKSIPVRGEDAEAEITEPTDKEPEKRFTGRSSSRGRFKLMSFDGKGSS